jgi:hypothetical protein
MRLVVAATLVGLATLAIVAVLAAAEVLDVSPLAASVVALVLAGSVLVWAPLRSTWAVRGVVLWALLITGAVGLMTWVLDRILSSSLDVAGLTLSGAGWLLLLLSIGVVLRHARDWIAARAGLGVEAPEGQHLAVLRPVLSLAALLAASGVVVAVTNDDTGPGQGPSPQAAPPGPSGISTTAAFPSSGPTLTGGTSGPALATVHATEAIHGDEDLVLGTARLRPPTPDVVPSPVWTTGSAHPDAAPAGTARPLTPSETSGGSGAGGGEAAPVRRSNAPEPTSTRTTTAALPTPTAGRTSGTRSPSTALTPFLPDFEPAPKPAKKAKTQRPSAPPTTRPSHPVRTSSSTQSAATPVAPETAEPSKTPGYAKYKPNRPTDAPSPGSGRTNNP